MSAHEHDSTPAPVAPPRRGRLVRALGWGVALPLALLVGGGAWLAGTQSGLDAALGLAARATSGALQVEGARGPVEVPSAGKGHRGDASRRVA